MAYAIPEISAITASDETIKDALKEAHIPSLMAALVHLTGDTSHIEASPPPIYDMFSDNQGNLPEDLKEEVRAQAFALITAARDGKDMSLKSLSDAQIQTLMNFAAGAPIPEHYMPLLKEELGLDTSASRFDTWGDEVPASKKEAFNVVIIGAGMSGLLAAISLQAEGIPYTIIEKNGDVSGTWLENDYPGCRVDSPNHIYSFSFEPNPTWPQFYSTQKVLLDYFKDTADKYDVRKNIQFNAEVTKAQFDETTGTWKVDVRRQDGGSETLTANAVISAVGQLNRPAYPDIQGIDRFKGASFHSAAWDHSVDLKGKKVAVIGTGASAFQFVPEIVDDVAEMTVFQRSAPWLSPAENYHHDVPEGMIWMLANFPYFERWYRFQQFWIMTDGVLPAVEIDPNWHNNKQAVSELNDMMRVVLTDYIKGQVPEGSDFADKMIPDYPPGGKRMLRDNGVWLSALQRDHVEVVTDPIREITATGLVTESGREIEADIIIYGTGFRVSEFLAPMEIKGKDGIDLNEQWDGDAKAYLGVTIPNFPNLFLLYGPNTNIVVNGSIIFFSECEMRYVKGCLKLLIENDLKSMACKQEVHDAFNVRVDEGNAKMAWGSPHVDNWYKNATGRVAQNWPFPLIDYWTETLAPNPDDFHLV